MTNFIQKVPSSYLMMLKTMRIPEVFDGLVSRDYVVKIAEETEVPYFVSDAIAGEKTVKGEEPLVNTLFFSCVLPEHTDILFEQLMWSGVPYSSIHTDADVGLMVVLDDSLTEASDTLVAWWEEEGYNAYSNLDYLIEPINCYSDALFKADVTEDPGEFADYTMEAANYGQILARVIVALEGEKAGR